MERTPLSIPTPRIVVRDGIGSVDSEFRVGL